jgi:hypothetical protein
VRFAGYRFKARNQEGMALIQEGIAATRAAGTNLGRSYYLYRLAKVYMEANGFDDGLGALSEALAAPINMKTVTGKLK